MAMGHSRHTVITVAGTDVSATCKNSELTRGADKHDTTGYGATDHEFGDDGLGTGEFTMDGIYHTGATGPRGVILPLKGSNAAFVRKPEGVGAGKPVETFTAFIEEYKETAAFADYIKWAMKATVSGAVVDSVG
jgi:hypothetical protein